MSGARRALVIEDDPGMRRLIDRVLARARYEVSQSSSGAVIGAYRLVRRIGQGRDRDVFIAVHCRNGREAVVEVARGLRAAAPDSFRA